MALYELRTYTLHVGKMAEGVKLYQEFGFPALENMPIPLDPASPEKLSVETRASADRL